MTTENTARAATPWRRARWPLAVGISAAATVLALGVGWMLNSGSETFRTAPELVARLGKLGAPCAELKLAGNDTEGLCRTGGESFVVVTDTDRATRDVAKWRAGQVDLDGDAVAAGDGWYVYGDPVYVTRVADLLDAELIS